MTIERVRDQQSPQPAPEPVKLKSREEAKRAEEKDNETSEIKKEGDERPTEKRVSVKA